MPRIIRRERAITDLLEHWSYIAVEGSVERADAFLDRVERKVFFLSEFPYSGRARDTIRPRLRSVPVPRSRYVIFFYPLDDGIIISRVLYGGRDIEAIYEDEGSEP